MPVETYTVTESGVFENDAGTRRNFFADGVIAMSTAYEYGLPDATTPDDPDPLNTESKAYVDAGDAATLASAVAADATGLNAKRLTEARTATAAPGGTTGVISANVDTVVVTTDNADKVITLPAPVVGHVITLRNGATGYELRSSDPATIAINGGTAANAESAIGANITTVCRCTLATAWVCTNYAADGTVTATQAAA